MAQRRSLAWSELKVGLLVLASFAALTYAVISIGGPASFWGKKMTITAYFNSASAVRPGNDVWLDGLLVGKVEEVGLNKNPSIPGRVAVKLKIDATYSNNIRKDSVVGIEAKGGKAVATSGGVLLAIFPLLIPIGLIAWVLAFLITRMSSVGSLTAAVVEMIAGTVLYMLGYLPLAYAVFIWVMVVFIVYLHRANIQRLIAGTENRFSRML